MPYLLMVLLLTSGPTRVAGTDTDSDPPHPLAGFLAVDVGACVDSGDAEVLRRIIEADFDRFIADHPGLHKTGHASPRFVVQCARDREAVVLAIEPTHGASAPRLRRRIQRDEIPPGVAVAFLSRLASEMLRGVLRASIDREASLHAVRTPTRIATRTSTRTSTRSPVRRPVRRTLLVDGVQVRSTSLGRALSSDRAQLRLEGGVLAFTRAVPVYETMSLAYDHPLGANAGVIVRVGGFSGHPKVESETARVLGLHLDLAAGLQRDFGEGAFSVGVSVGVRGGWAYLSGVSSPLAEGVRSSAPTFGPAGALALDWEVLRPLTVGLQMSGGYTYFGAIGRINGARRIQVVGPWVSVCLSAGLVVW
ncbi:MAG: hypothetical protein H6729_07640 [Deltaproteobacteria bacterium]|nr:hypothetical protein [Deltaproteobacteria bacterium]